MYLVRLAKTVGVAAVCFTAVGCGCAKKTDLDSLGSDLRREIRTSSDQSAQAAANAAAAKQIAEQANQRSLNTEEAVNRGFKKSMRK